MAEVTIDKPKIEETKTFIEKDRGINVGYENFIQKIEPDYYIKIGIKNNKVIEMNWEDIILNGFDYKDKKEIIELLKQTIKFMKRNNR